MTRSILGAGLVLALLLGTPIPGIADEAPQTQLWAPWEADFQKARRLLEDEEHEAAREAFRDILERYPDLEIQDRAVSGLASTYLAERRYARAIRYLEGAIEEHASLARSRTLYSAVEDRVSRALARARVRERRIREEYEDISWWNLFRIFEKLGHRRYLKDAERDVEELQDLRNLFRPELLLPLPLRPPADPPMHIMESGTSSSGASTGTTSTGSGSGAAASADPATLAKASETVASAATAETTGTPVATTADASATTSAPASPTTTSAEETVAPAASDDGATDPATAEDPKAEAFRVLADEIDALLVLIPADKIGAAELILAGRVESAAASAVASEAASDETASAESETTTAATPVVVTGEESSSDPSATTTPAAEDPDAAVVETVAPAAPSETATAPAEATVATSAPVLPPAPVTSGSLREAYFAAYRDLQAALAGSDPAAIQEARQAYMAALAAMRGAQWGVVQGTSGAPAAPGSPQVVEPVVRSPIGNTSHQAGRGTYQQDRLGVFRGTGDGGLGASRGSFQR